MCKADQQQNNKGKNASAPNRPPVSVTGNASTFHHTRMKIALEVHPEIRDLFGPDRRGALITVAAHIAHSSCCISNPWRMVKHAVTGEGIPRPFRLPAWFFVAGWLYQMAFALLPAIAAAYLWPDRQITAALHVVLVNFLAETWQYLPMLPFTGGLVFNTLDHLLVKGDQPSFSIQNRVLYWLSVGFFYHMEHHDFARIPSWKLHKLASIAPEFYSQIEDFGALERLHAWVLKDWQHVELSKMGLILDELRAARRKMDLRIDFSGFTQPQYDRAVAIAKSMDVVVT